MVYSLFFLTWAIVGPALIIMSINISQLKRDVVRLSHKEPEMTIYSKQSIAARRRHIRQSTTVPIYSVITAMVEEIGLEFHYEPPKSYGWELRKKESTQSDGQTDS